MFLKKMSLLVIALACMAAETSLASEETKPVVTVINHGLLTQIQAIIITEPFRPGLFQEIPINEYYRFIGTSCRKGNLIEFINYPIGDDTEHVNPINSLVVRRSEKKFLPMVLKEVDSSFYENKGIFRGSLHSEAIEACRQNQAVYYSGGRGAIIYNTDKQPKINVEIVQEMLKKDWELNFCDQSKELQESKGLIAYFTSFFH